MNPNLNPAANPNRGPGANLNHDPRTMSMTRTSDWRFAANWGFAGLAATWFAVNVVTVSKSAVALMATGILLAALGYAAGWNAKGRTDGR